MDFDLTKSISVLERTPHVIRRLIENLADDWTHNDYGPDTWSVKQVLGHLIYGDRTDWIPRARHILEHGDTKPFEPFDRAGHFDLCRHKTLDELLDLFAREREQNLDSLQALSLSDDDLNRPGLHPALGQVHMSQLLATWTVHDLNHIAQICKAMAYQYKSEVGPWEAYLSILAPPSPH